MAELGFENIHLHFGDVAILNGAGLQIDRGERIGLLGRNGCGKSTLMKLVAGEIEPDEGQISRRQGLTVARLAQEVPRDLEGTVDDVLRAPLAGLAEEGDWQADARVGRVVSQLKLDPQANAATLSAGNQRRVLLGRALVLEPDLLLLDEPTNHLDIEAIEAIEELFQRYAGSLLFVTHDRAFLRRLATRILDLDRGVMRSYRCDYTTYLGRKAAELEAEATANAAFDKKLAQEEAWLRRGIKARRTRNEGRVRDLMSLREERKARREVVGGMKAKLQEADRSGRLVIRATDLSHAFDGGPPVLAGVSTEIQRGDRVGIIGPNGSGKTTLIRALLGELETDAGSVRHGENLEVARFDQLHSVLDETKTVQENVAPDSDQIIVGGRPRHIQGYLQDFLFTPDQIRGQITQLSGGERNRLQLARVLARPCNVLVLDEPTNDLDLESLELLESILADYSGTLLLVSHDREFLDNVVTSTLVFEGEGRVHEYFGGYEDWLVQRKPASASASAGDSAKPGDSPGPKRQSRQPTPRTRRLTFKEKHELEALPQRLETLEEQRDALVETMASPEFFKRDGAAIAAEKERLDKLESELAEAYERWETLEAISEGRVTADG